MSVFARFSPRLQQAIATRLGWSSLRPVQEEAGEALLAGKNAVVLAPTAGGKTEASMFPTLNGMVESGPVGVGALYIAPIKALLNNQAERLGVYTEMVGLRRFVWHGDIGASARNKFKRDPAELLMTTPESLEVMLVSRGVDATKLFSDLRVVVIDEIHAMAGSDRGAHLMSVLERLNRISKHDLQRVGLSATVGNPDDILAWLQGTSRREAVVVDPPKQPGRRQILIVRREDQESVAEDAANVARGNKSLFFCQSRSTTEAVAEHMRRFGTEVFVHHSAVSKEERALAEERFHRGSDACIVCTSTLELGIDVGDLDKVLQAEAPDTVSSFLQRMGRTGRRAGKAANTTFFCESSEGVLQAIALVELAKAGWVESVEVTDRCWPVMVHQLLVMALATDGVSVDDAWAHLSQVPDFAGIHRAEFERLVAWMLHDRSLVRVSGLLVIGPKAERRFGRRNFMEMYAVFESPQSYAVETSSGQPLGTLNQAFVDRLVEGVSCFLLGGRAWAVDHVFHDDRRVRVSKAPRGKKPTWGGFLPQFLGFELCQKIRDVLSNGVEYGFLHPEAAATLAEQREQFAAVVGDERGIEIDDGEVRWWTFAGGRINSTLRYALQAIDPSWKVVPDNFLLKVRGEGISQKEFLEALAQLRDPEFWENDALWAGVARTLPNYRLSKFQSLFPPWVEREVIADYLLDVEGAWFWVSGATSERRARGLPEVIRQRLPEDPERPVAPRVPERPPAIEPAKPVEWIANDDALAALCAELASEPVIALDVETTLGSHALCLVQLGTPERNYVVDALEVTTLEPLGALLGSSAGKKVIHNATFERSVLGRYGIDIQNVVDTLTVSRDLRGRELEDGHGLKAVCARELGIELDKTEQTSDWTRRPLTKSQLAYAAMDVEVLVSLWKKFEPLVPQGEFEWTGE